MAAVSLVVAVRTGTAIGPEAYTSIAREFPGSAVAAATAVLRAVNELFAVLSIGTLTLSLMFTSRSSGLGWSRASESTRTMLRVFSGVWSSASLLLIVVDALNTNGTSFSTLQGPEELWFAMTATFYSRAWLIVFIASFLVFAVSMISETWAAHASVLWIGSIAVLAPVVISQVLVGPNHDLGEDAAIVQTPVAAIVLGAVASGVLVQLLHPRTGLLQRMTRSWLLWLGVLIIVDFDIVVSWFKLAEQPLLDSTTGWQMLTRWAALAIIIIGLLRLRFGRSAWAAGAVLVGFAGWISMTAAMTLVPSPNYFAQAETIEVFLGYTVDAAPEVLTLVSEWRIDLLAVTVAFAGMFAYAIGVRALRRHGDSWPVMRTISWMIGWAVTIVITSSGWGRYAPADFGLHMIVHMTLNMVVPALLVLGAPLTLILQATSGPGRVEQQEHARIKQLINWRWARYLLHPLFVFVVYVASYYVLYLTPLFEELIQYHWGHQLMNVHFLIVGYMFFSLVIGVDRLPFELPHIGRLGYVIAAMPFHAFFGIVLTMTEVPIAQNFYRTLDQPWLDIAAEQRFAGAIAWAGGELPLLGVVIILGVQWTTQDKRAPRRFDRHEGPGLNDEFTAYDEMLGRLAERDGITDAAEEGKKTHEQR